MTVASPVMNVRRRQVTPSRRASMHIAMIDVDSGFLHGLALRLESAGWQHRVLAGAIPLDVMVAMRLNACVIDLAVLGPRGWDYLERLCARLPGLGVLVCTGRSSLAERVRGLQLGADDWLTKPSHPDEVMARIEAIVRRRKHAQAATTPAPLTAGELQIRPDLFEAFADGSAAALTRREFELIHLLSTAQGQVMQREEIYERVWGYAMARGDRSVDVFVGKLRHKLERISPAFRYVHTHFGIGYRFAAERIERKGPA